jgi:hypothetical protein
MSVTLRRYALPSVKGEGWAIIVIGSDGYFSTVSDWGNYSYIWTHPGCEFRKFLVGVDAYYFRGKITHGRKAHVWDQERTKKNIGKRLWDLMGDGVIDKVQHDEALSLLDDHICDEAEGIRRWVDLLDFDFGDLCEGIWATKAEPQSLGFATHILPRFQQMLRDELAVEAVEPNASLERGDK